MTPTAASPDLTSKRKILFAVNKTSGPGTIDFTGLIHSFFQERKDITYAIATLVSGDLKKALREHIRQFAPQIVVAVGGDGTIKLVAEIVMGSQIPIGIIPAGSANGMAKELGIPPDPADALERIISGNSHPIHLTRINGCLCIHLSDIGFNAFLVKKFQKQERRGMWGYLKAAWSALWRHYTMEATFRIGDKTVTREAVMIVIANATRYGTGITINPLGKLDDRLFEVVIIRKISIPEIIKMRLAKSNFHPQKTELIQADNIVIASKKKVHFQVDGEYYGKVNRLVAEIMPEAIQIIY